MSADGITLLCQANWSERRVPEAAKWLRDWLIYNLKPSQRLSTKDMFAMLDVPGDKRKTVTNGLSKIRSAGLVNDCFTRDESKRFMGNPLIVWITPMRQGTTSPEAAESSDTATITPEEF